jgi:hypothetical protein
MRISCCLEVAVGSVSASGKNCVSPPVAAIHTQSFDLHSEQDRSPIRKDQSDTLRALVIALKITEIEVS